MSSYKGNISISLREVNVNRQNKPTVTYQELLNEVDCIEMCVKMTTGDSIAREVEYEMNHNKSQLNKIAEYYSINSDKEREKYRIIEDIVSFENNTDNIEIVFQRNKLWSYIQEIKADVYLSKYLIFD